MTDPASRTRKRRDGMGRAHAGSQRQIQLYVNRHRAALDEAILAAVGAEQDGLIDWRAPLAAHGYAEYMDGSFLRALGLESLATALKEFWPRSGPRWDGLAVLRRLGSEKPAGYLLIEAKSYPDEVRGAGCKAEGDSLAQIERSIAWTRERASPAVEADWLGPLYQSANRVAHVFFLREQTGLPVHLVNVCFLDDPHRSIDRQSWDAGLAELKREFGYEGREVPHSVDVFLSGRPRDEEIVERTA